MEAVHYLRGKGLRVNNKDIVDKTGLDKSTVSGYMKNNPKPSSNFIEKFSNEYGVNSDYILYGIGTLTGDPPPSLNGSKEKILEDLKQALRDLEAVKTDVALLKKIVLKQE